MHFRPCIDIHNGQVKQIVGGTLSDLDNKADDNFVSSKGGEYFAKMYKDDGLKGGHIILLNPPQSEYYQATKLQAIRALDTYPNGLQIGGGITVDNAQEYIELGASHVIVTSYVFKDGQINYDNLYKISNSVGKEHLVLDLSCRKKDNKYYIVTDRWQKFADTTISYKLLDELAKWCDEFLIHAVDVEGKVSGIEKELVSYLGKWEKNFPITYAGGVASIEDIRLLEQLGNGKLDVTIGSALDIFGGKLSYRTVVEELI